ncbi:hypothetical protein HF313_16310 [Massilia atriviolacea]|uniref:Phage head morphogenesis domain-containing protein n=1 Tax=Massilia atriviolacea TaxID=2495579 RepID=A0A430HU73_9BURK|nr:hypothetical protein [Massilia atriviolacea]RSZ61121.1 hypothetical protein EJB06_03075 [Massilia atriviolacea]
MDLLIQHNVLMLRAEAEVKAKVLALLIPMQKDIVGVLASAPALSELDKAGKSALLRKSNALIADYYGRAQLVADLGAMAQVEALGVHSALSTVIEARIGVGMPTENYLVSDTLMLGSPARTWWLRQQQDTAFELATQIRIGAAQGETNAQIVARVVGTDEIPGVMPMARKNALSTVQTSMAGVAAAARRATFEMNRHLMTAIEQVSTMDGHSGLMCIAYGGAQWDLHYEPMGENHLQSNDGVPRHHGCRSTEIAVMKIFREMGIDLDEPEEGARASSSGPISAKTTFADYLTMKGADYQNEVLGPGRAALFREGKLAPRDLVNMSGRPLKLSASRRCTRSRVASAHDIPPEIPAGVADAARAAGVTQAHGYRRSRGRAG